MKKTLMKWALGAMSVLTLAACGGGSGGLAESSSAAAGSSQAAGGDKLAQVQERGTLVVGTSADYPPYEWHLIKDGKDEIVGFDIDIAEKIAEELGVELEVQDMDFNGLLPALSTGKVDMVIAGMNPIPERLESVDFTDIYVTTEDVVLIRKEDAEKYQSMEDLKEARWATQKATIQEDFLKETYPDSSLQSVGKWGTAIMSLNTGKVDAVLMVETVASQYAEQNDNLMIADVDPGSTPNEAAIAVAKNGGEFLETVNGIVNQMQEDGTIEQLILENVELMEANTTE